ncbi:putative membrane protein [Chryseobacterium sp. 16F]|uniref:Putative membrane protein n=1 Tax=Frigoriflavimonas asaccharolytica TaxID=2735899 RepID=A0A8J8K9K3_9FLAO|nr:putative membrane protein [Frigoriflavimonas asaccharolytica]
MKKFLFILLAIILEIFATFLLFLHLAYSTPSKSGPGSVMEGFGGLFLVLVELVAFNIFYIIVIVVLYRFIFYKKQMK